MRFVTTEICHLLLFFAITLEAKENYVSWPAEIKIVTQQSNIIVGEPLVINIQCRFDKSLLLKNSNSPPTSIHRDAFVRITNVDTGQVLQNRYPIFANQYLQELQDQFYLKYSGFFVLFYDHLNKQLIFNSPGTYTLELLMPFTSDKNTSNSLRIKVTSAPRQNDRSLSFLSEPEDYMFLEYGEHENPEELPKILSHLSKVVSETPNTLLAKWCAARLGTIQFEKLHKQYPDVRKFIAQHQDGKITDPLFKETLSLISKAYNLPDAFAIREQVLTDLSVLKVMNGNYDEASSLLDELSSKYHYGKYGNQASKVKEELHEIVEKLGRPIANTSHKFLRTVILTISVGIVFLVVVGFGILSLRRKTSKE